MKCSEYNIVYRFAWWNVDVSIFDFHYLLLQCILFFVQFRNVIAHCSYEKWWTMRRLRCFSVNGNRSGKVISIWVTIWCSSPWLFPISILNRSTYFLTTEDWRWNRKMSEREESHWIGLLLFRISWWISLTLQKFDLSLVACPILRTFQFICIVYFVYTIFEIWWEYLHLARIYTQENTMYNDKITASGAYKSPWIREIWKLQWI